MNATIKAVSGFLVLSLLGFLLLSAGVDAASSPNDVALEGEQGEVTVSEPVTPAISPAVRSLPASKNQPILNREINPRKNPRLLEPNQGKAGSNTNEIDPLVLRGSNGGQTPDPILNFDGLSSNGPVPPDIVGDVGPNHYVQMVNVQFAIYNKSGTQIQAPTDVNQLWNGQGGNCQSNNDGDPIALYDPMADRWLLSQFASPAHLCVAISQSPDPTGSYYLYEFNVGEFPDYFKFGVWPDAYYMSANENSYTAYAFDRSKMLAGQAATFQKVTGQTNLLLPSDLDGATAPPDDAPNYFYTFKDSSYHGDGSDRIEVFAFDVDWDNTNNTNFSLLATIPIASFNYTVCEFFNFQCIPQPSPGESVDAVSEWPMWRFQYRNFGSHETLVGNFTVDTNGSNHAGIRWFELRKSGGGNWTLHQEGTHAPDSHHRWMGSIAMDRDGNMGLGYSISSSSLNPGIRYVTRLANDPTGTLHSEVTLIDGGGVQTGGGSRWGDYSSMNVDPADDCTFWYTTEYYQTTSSGSWRTRIGTFKIPSCGDGGDDTPTPTATSPANTVTPSATSPANTATPSATTTTPANTATPSATSTATSPDPQIEVAPSSLSSTQGTDEEITKELTISNVGGEALTWSITEEMLTNSSAREAFQQAFEADRLPAQALPAQAETPCVNGMAGSYPCDNIDLLAFMPLNQMGGGEGNDIWGWTDSQDGKEIAIMGRTNGTSFVDISNPESPIYLGNLPGHNNSTSSWRDIKVYNNHAFIVSEASNHGMQVFDLTQLRNVSNPPATFSETAHYDDFGNAHNIIINEQSGFAYAVGSFEGTSCGGGLHIINIQSPTSPTYAGCFSADGYTHDAQCVIYNGPDASHQGKEICFNANEDTLTIVDVTDKSNPTELSRTGYTGSSYAHQGWLTEDQSYFLLNDEGDEQTSGHNTRTYIWNVSDLDNASLIGNYTSSVAAIDHNLYVKDNYVYEANYRAGLRILDTSDVANGNLSEKGYFDIYPASDSPQFNGAWSTYPYFESGVVLVSGIEQGLFVLQPNLGGGEADFTLDVVDNTLNVCEGNDVSTTVNLGAVAGYDDSVTLNATGLPTGASASFDSSSVSVPGDSQISVTTSGADVGSHSFTVSGTDGSLTHSENVTLNVSAGAPNAASLSSPADNAANLSLMPTFSWNSSADAESYLLELATDANFNNIVYNDDVEGTTHTITTSLNQGTTYYWRVTAQNGCGSNTSSVSSFTTELSGEACESPTDITWLAVSPASGSTALGNSTIIDVVFDSSGLNDGTYNATLCIESNDPVNSLVTVPISLMVGSDITPSPTATDVPTTSTPTATSVPGTATATSVPGTATATSVPGTATATATPVATAIATVEPEKGGTVISEDGDVMLDFPSGAVDGMTTVIYSEQGEPSQSTGLFSFAGTSFSVDAFDENNDPVETFNENFTLTVQYEDEDWMNAGIKSEEALSLFYWDGSQWVDLMGCDGCSHDTTNNVITINLNHLTEFALLADSGMSNLLYLPLISR